MPSHPKAAALKLPDQLLVRYFRGGEIDAIAKVEVREDKIGVHLKLAGKPRFDHWRDLGGGLALCRTMG